MMDPKHFNHCLDILDMLYYPNLSHSRINIQTSRINDMKNVKYQIGYTKEQEEIWKHISIGKAGKNSIRDNWGHDLKVTIDDTEVHEGPWEFHGWIRDTINKGDNNFKGWLCDTGMTGVHIAPNGNIFKGVCHGSYDMHSSIGNINKPVSIERASQIAQNGDTIHVKSGIFNVTTTGNTGLSISGVNHYFEPNSKVYKTTTGPMFGKATGSTQSNIYGNVKCI